MKLTCSQDALNSNLQCVSRAVAARPTHPVLANVLLTADQGTGRVSLTGFDLSLGIQTTFTAAVEQSGAITLPSRLLSDIVSRLSADSPLSLHVPGSDAASEDEGGDNDRGGSLPLEPDRPDGGLHRPGDAGGGLPGVAHGPEPGVHTPVCPVPARRPGPYPLLPAAPTRPSKFSWVSTWWCPLQP